jgi:Ribosomal L28e protein family
MATVSSDLLWELLKGQNSFSIRKNGKDFTSDPFSLNNTQRQKYLGLASNSAVGVSSRKKDEPVAIILKKLRKNQPKKNQHLEKVLVKRGGFAGPAKTAFKSFLEARNPSLVGVGLARLKKLHSSELAKKPISRKP